MNGATHRLALVEAVRRAARAAECDSNDAEIEALQDVRDLACEALRLDPITGEPTERDPWE